MRIFLTGLALLIGAVSVQAEELHLGLSQERISITSSFNGTNMIIFGSVEGGDPVVQATDGYDVVVVLKGPDQPANIRQKERVVGIWVNTAGRVVEGSPGSYSLSTTKPLEDIANPVTTKGLGIGFQNIKVDVENDADGAFSKAFLRLKKQKGLYLENSGGIKFLSAALFKASVEIPANIPIGEHAVKGYLFNGGSLVGTATTSLIVEKSGFEDFTYRSAKDHGLIYGIICVILAMFAGWLASILFRRK